MSADSTQRQRAYNYSMSHKCQTNTAVANNTCSVLCHCSHVKRPARSQSFLTVRGSSASLARNQETHIFNTPLLPRLHSIRTRTQLHATGLCFAPVTSLWKNDTSIYSRFSKDLSSTCVSNSGDSRFISVKGIDYPEVPSGFYHHLQKLGRQLFLDVGVTWLFRKYLRSENIAEKIL
jgi:hypothetical protein